MADFYSATINLFDACAWPIIAPGITHVIRFTRRFYPWNAFMLPPRHAQMGAWVLINEPLVLEHQIQGTMEFTLHVIWVTEVKGNRLYDCSISRRA